MISLHCQCFATEYKLGAFQDDTTAVALLRLGILSLLIRAALSGHKAHKKSYFIYSNSLAVFLLQEMLETARTIQSLKNRRPTLQIWH